MFKATTILGISLSALVLIGAMVVFDPLPVQAQTEKKLNCTGCVRSKQIKDNKIKSRDIKDGHVRNADLANNAVNSQKIADGTVGEADLADGAVTFEKLGSDVKELVPPSFELRDKNGQVVGTVLTILQGAVITRVGFKDSFAILRNVPLLVFRDRIDYGGTLFYAAPNCNEAMGVFIRPREALSPAFDPSAILLMPSARPLYVANSETAFPVPVESSFDSEEPCDTFPAVTMELLSAEKVVNDLNNAFKAPYELVIN